MKTTLHFQNIEKSVRCFIWRGLIRYHIFDNYDENLDERVLNAKQKIKEIIGNCNIRTYTEKPNNMEEEELLDYNGSIGLYLIIELYSKEDNDVFSFYNESRAFYVGKE